MTDTTISDAVFYPEDEGTGVPDGDEDYDSAAYDALLSQAVGEDSYKGSGLGFTNVVTTDGSETVDVTAGHAFVVDDASVTGGARSGNPVVQSSFQQSYDTTLPADANPTYVVILPTSVSNLALDTDTTNDLWLFVDPGGSNDTVQIRHGSNLSEPSLPSVKLGTVDSADGSTSETNVGPNQVDTNESTVPSSVTRLVEANENQTISGDYEVNGTLEIEQDGTVGVFRGDLTGSGTLSGSGDLVGS